MTETYMQAAFNQVCDDAKKPEGVYLCLMERATYYGGPEEGGWWGHDFLLAAYKHYSTREAAEMAKGDVEKLANTLSADSRRAFGNQCLREMEWLEARGLDSDFLPEPDGDSQFYVTVSEGLPENEYGSRHYE